MKNFKLLSLDVWDTLVRRKCHPDEIKIHTCNFLHKLIGISCEFTPLQIFLKRLDLEAKLAHRSIARGFDDEYRIYDVFFELLISLNLDLSIGKIKNLTLQLINFEVSTEIDLSYLDPLILNFISEFSYSKIAFISDFYISSSSLTEIISSNTNIKFDYGFVSCDFLVNKKTGKLFQEIHKALDIDPLDHLHIGDNPLADIEPLLNLGGSALIYTNQEETKKKIVFNKQFSTRLFDKSSYFLNLRKIIDNGIDITSHNRNLKMDQLKLFTEGYKHSPLYLSFILYIIENVRDNEVFYFTREGLFFEKIHQLVLEFYLENFQSLVKTTPKPKILEVSRLSTFFISLREFSISELMRIWTLYSTQSLHQLFLSLNLDYENYIELIDKYQISFTEQIIYPWLDKRLIHLFEDKSFLDALSQEYQEKRSVFVKFLESKGILQNLSDIYIVDIGWRGSIQDNLSYILDKTKIHGIYFGLQKFLNPQPINVTKIGYLSNQNVSQDDILDFVSPLEMLCNAPGGSVTGYRYIRDTENLEIQKKIYPLEDAVFYEFIAHYQNGVLEGCKNVLPYITQHALNSQELRDYSHRVFKDLINSPDPSIVKAYFSLEHNEVFGVGEVVSKRKFFGLSHFFTVCNQSLSKLSQENASVKSFLLTFNEGIKKTGWPQAYLVSLHVPFLVYLYQRRNQIKKQLRILANFLNLKNLLNPSGKIK